jgi:hypothetical protein
VGQKVMETLSQQTSLIWRCVPVIPAMWEVIGRKIIWAGPTRPAPGKNRKLA